jgi:hypothetical protein
LYNALSGFHVDLSGNDETGYRVTVGLEKDEHRVLAVLGAVEEFVTARNDGPALVERAGRRYTRPSSALTGAALDRPLHRSVGGVVDQKGEPRLRCVECERAPRDRENAEDEWRYLSDWVGFLHVFCRECAEREFGADARARRGGDQRPEPA